MTVPISTADRTPTDAPASLHFSRRWALGASAAGLVSLLPGCGGGSGRATQPHWPGAGCTGVPGIGAAPTDPVLAAAVRSLALDTLNQRHARAVLVRVTRQGKEIFTQAFGESAPGESATTDMYFRNGAVAIALVATLVLRLVEERVLALDDVIARWLPDLPHAGKVTVRHLLQMTSGYADYVQDPAFIDAFMKNPERSWTPAQLLAHAVHKPLFFEPGTNWAYAHTNYVILGWVIERVTGRPVHEAMQDKVLGPLCLSNTSDPASPHIPSPVLRAYSSERREVLGIAPGQDFYEESTLWDPSWTITHGAIQVTNLADLHACAVAFGRGTLLSRAMHAEQVSTALRGRTSPVDGCPSCRAHTNDYAYGLGVVLSGNWVLQTPQFGGYSAVAAYHEGADIAIATVVTYQTSAYDDQGAYKNGNEAENLFGRIGALVLPTDPPPIARTLPGLPQ